MIKKLLLSISLISFSTFATDIDEVTSISSLSELRQVLGESIDSNNALAEISNHFPTLARLNLSRSRISGPIPTLLGNLIGLTSLSLNDNQLSGSIPVSLGNLVNLKTLNLRNNQLSGPIPASLGDCTKLEYLNLRNNQLSGLIPASLGNLNHLKIFNLDNNQLLGSIPDELGKLTALQELYLNNNQLSGPIPASLGNCTNLTHLILGNNQLSGHVPASLENLNRLTTLTLSHNFLTSISSNLFKINAHIFLNNNRIQSIRHEEEIRTLSFQSLRIGLGNDFDVNTILWFNAHFNHQLDRKQVIFQFLNLSSPFHELNGLYLFLQQRNILQRQNSRLYRSEVNINTNELPFPYSPFITEFLELINRGEMIPYNPKSARSAQ